MSQASPFPAAELRAAGTLPLVLALRAPDSDSDSGAGYDEGVMIDEALRALREFRRAFPGTPILARSLLADPSDARLALAAAKSEGVEVEALLPAERSVEAHLSGLGLDVADGAHLGVAPARLQRRAARIEPDGRADAEWRRAAGKTLVRHAITLVSGWSDEGTAEAGSARELVRFITLGPELGEVEDDAPRIGPADLGPVLRVPLRPKGALEWWLPDRDPFAAGSRPWRRGIRLRGLWRALGLPPDLAPLRRHNRRVATLEAASDTDCAELPEPLRSESTRRALARYLAADAVSIRGQRHSRSLRWTLIGLTLAASFGLTFYAGDTGSALWLTTFVGSITLASILVVVARRWHVEEGWLDTRMLAEGLRVLRAWHAAAVPDDPVRAYPLEHALDTTWIRQALRATWVALDAAPRDEALRREGNAWAQVHWVQGQERYYRESIARDRKYARRWTWGLGIARSVLTVGVVVLPIAFVFDGAALEWLRRAAIFAVAASFTLLGTLRTLQDGYSFDLQKAQYGWCHRLFATEADRSRETAYADELDAVQSRHRALGRHALEEQSAWLMFHRLRPIQHE